MVCAIDLRLWAKWGDYDADAANNRYPLLAHLIDTLVVAEHLHDTWLSPSARTRLSRLTGVGESALRPTLARLAGLHDLGKANPIFQGQLAHPTPDFADHMAALADAGYWVPAQDDAKGYAGEALVRRHEAVTGTFLTPESDDGYAQHAEAIALAGHHGHFRIADPTNTETLAYQDFLDETASGPWRDQVNAHQQLVESLTPGWQPLDAAPHSIPILTAFICLADWVASDQDAVAAGSLAAAGGGAGWEDFARVRRAWFADRVAALGTPERPIGNFTSTFGFPPNALQDSLVARPQSGLTIVAAPMGEGKTEAALARWQVATDGRRLYFALPTMATADAMFDRIRSFLTTTSNVGALTHSRASLNSFYAEPARTFRPIPATPDCGEDSDPSGLTPQNWFRGRHRALLSPIAVGTVDQLLSGVLKHKFNFMRLLGAFDATLVLDEVHSYDPYMAELVRRLLEWCGALGIDVILLSATLPSAQVHTYVNAYRHGLELPPVDDIALSNPMHLHQPASTLGAEARTADMAVTALSDTTPAARREITLQHRTVRHGRLANAVVAEVEALLREHPAAKVGVIVNTVNVAQDVADRLRGSVTGLHVLHSRMTGSQRYDATTAALEEFSKTSRATAAVLVATQVAEQSLDVDFDVLVTQLAPAPSLLQRCGRVWRHVTTNPARPAAARPVSTPTVIVVSPLEVAWPGTLPYTVAEMQRTWTHALDKGARGRVLIPDDLAPMVDAAHVTWDTLVATESESDTASPADQAHQHHVIDTEARRLAATRRAIPPPASVTLPSLASFTGDRDHIDEYNETRWTTQASVTVILTSADLAHPARRYLAHPDLLAEDRHRGDATTRQLLGATVPVTGTLAVELGVRSRTPDTGVTTFVHESPLLHSTLAVDLDRCADFELDSHLGLRRARGQ
ncbi:CRISPR-associated helicase Cas3' [Nocardioides sp. GY 10113]|uniref:CRISPR-associated helicase Cas3' n=1 Tax=Nocardioides sp. GY 10113 TaxID=2569761 RepID=UPI0010A7EDC5|nr:CRISPR-associated helicase Cas3' [Nocardioides sp. GY 10113]TIC82195.1 CRISPR-associated helicase Cas3' [Nocardioides sp. GY 10113]